MDNLPSKKEKFFFWLIMGILSVVFVEVSTGSAMFPFFNPGVTLLVLPLYLLHTVFFLNLIYRYGKPSFWTLYAAGMLFGMYEAYLTKVLWTSYTSEGPPLLLGGVAVIETGVLVLFIHALLAFVLPVLLGEIMLTKSRDISAGLSLKTRNAILKRPVFWLLFIMAYLGVTQAMTSPSFFLSFLSGLGNVLFVALVVYLWRKNTQRINYNLGDFMLTKKGLSFVTFLLVLLYVIFIFFFDFVDLPKTLGPHLSILLLYVILIFVFVYTLEKSKQEKIEAVKGLNFSWKTLFKAGITFILVTTLLRVILVGGSALILSLAFTFLYILIGIILFIKTIRYCRK